MKHLAILILMVADCATSHVETMQDRYNKNPDAFRDAIMQLHKDRQDHDRYMRMRYPPEE